MGKMLRISNDFSSEASGPMLLKFHVEPPLVGGTKDCEFQMISPLKPLGQCCSNFMWSLLRLGERKIAKMVAVH